LLLCQKDKINLPQSDKHKVLLILRSLQHTQLNARKKQPQDTNCTWLLTGRRTSEEWNWVIVCWRQRFIAVHRNHLLEWTALYCWIGLLNVAYTETGSVCGYHIHFLWMNQFRNWQRCITTGWLRWSAMNLRLQQSVTHFSSSDVRRKKPSAVFILWLLFMCVQLSVLKVCAD